MPRCLFHLNMFKCEVPDPVPAWSGTNYVLSKGLFNPPPVILPTSGRIHRKISVWLLFIANTASCGYLTTLSKGLAMHVPEHKKAFRWLYRVHRTKVPIITSVLYVHFHEVPELMRHYWPMERLTEMNILEILTQEWSYVARIERLYSL